MVSPYFLNHERSLPLVVRVRNNFWEHSAPEVKMNSDYTCDSWKKQQISLVKNLFPCLPYSEKNLLIDSCIQVWNKWNKLGEREIKMSLKCHLLQGMWWCNFDADKYIQEKSSSTVPMIHRLMPSLKKNIKMNQVSMVICALLYRFRCVRFLKIEKVG